VQGRFVLGAGEGGGAVAGKDHVIVAQERLARRGFHAHVGGDTRHDHRAHALRAQHQVEVGSFERAVAVLDDHRLVLEGADAVELAVPFPRLAHRILDVGAVAPPPRLLQPHLREIPVGRRVVDVLDPHALHLRAARQGNEALELRHHRLDQGDIAPFALHRAAVGAEIVLQVDDQHCAVLRQDLFGQGAQHGVISRSCG
jgi:hypothetical protein